MLYGVSGRLRPDQFMGQSPVSSRDTVSTREARQGFELRDLRRTCETMLAAMGVSKDIRAQLQSHGLSGVQQRHYNRHEYMLEKRAALEKWGRQLDRIATGKPAKVVQLRERTG